MWLAHAASAAQGFSMCDLFSTDEAAQLVGQPIVNTVEGAENAQWVCARYGQHAATLLELKQYQSPADVNQDGGTEILGVGDKGAEVACTRRALRSVAVTSSGGRELAMGLSGSRCIGEL